MNHTPLKNKKVKLYYGYEDTIEFEGFEYESVKSAVRGLKQEIESRKIPIDKLPGKKAIVSDTKEKFVSDFNQEIDDILKTIDKWLEDVIE